MTSSTFSRNIEDAVPMLLDLARQITWNKLSDNCLFILTEIKHSPDNFHEQRIARKKENDAKIPVRLSELLLRLEALYENLYDVNLYVYKATRSLTIVDVRYYPKSSLDQDYGQRVAGNPPMIHCKVANPPWLSDKNEKFDVNWEHKEWLISWKLFWLRRKLKNAIRR